MVDVVNVEGVEDVEAFGDDEDVSVDLLKFEAKLAIIDACDACTDDISGDIDVGNPFELMVAIIDAKLWLSILSVKVKGGEETPEDAMFIMCDALIHEG